MRKIALSGLVALAAVLGGVAVPATAMAQPTSGAHPTPSVRPADDGPISTGLPMISCVLAVDCLGVQSSSSLTDGGPATPTRVARWNGSTWKGVGLTLPAGAKSADVTSVSCRAANSCLVVGDYYKSTSATAPDFPLALDYNGTSVRPTSAVPVPKGLSGVTLDAVSCTSSAHCVAVGSANGDSPAAGEVALIETWNGAKWTLHNVTVSPTSSSVPEVAGVSCATAAFCVLDGTSFSVSSKGVVSFGTWLASWNGTKLTTMKSAVAMEPTGISCATTSNCAVAGLSLDLGSTGTTNALTEIWNGSAWKLAKVTWPKGTDSFLLGLSCYGAHSCEAVGMDGPTSGDYADAAAVSFNGTAGRGQALPAPAKGYSDDLSSVSCPPRGSCVAVGERGKSTAASGTPMIATWSGKAWELHPGF